MVSELDSGQIVKRVFSDADDAIKIIPSSNTSFGIELSADDGDSTINRPESLSQSVSITSASTGVIIAAFSCKGMKQVNIHSKTTSVIVGTQAITVEYSPHDSDNIWIATTATVTPSLVNGTILSGTAVNILARRLRVSIAAPITSGTADIYLIAQGV